MKGSLSASALHGSEGRGHNHFPDEPREDGNERRKGDNREENDGMGVTGGTVGRNSDWPDSWDELGSGQEQEAGVLNSVLSTSHWPHPPRASMGKW